MAEKREIIYTVDVDSGKATKGIKETEDAVNDLGNSVEEVAQRGATMRESLQIGQAVVGGIAAFKGATALLGVENEKLLKTLTQLLGAQQMLMGMQKLMNTLESQNIILLKAKATAMGIYNAILKASAVSMAALTGGLTIFIGLAVSVISALRSESKARKENAQRIEDEFKALKKLNDEQVQNIQDNILRREREVELMKARGEDADKIFRKELALFSLRAKNFDEQEKIIKKEIDLIRTTTKSQEEYHEKVAQLEEIEKLRSENKHKQKVFLTTATVQQLKKVEDYEKETLANRLKRDEKERQAREKAEQDRIKLLELRISEAQALEDLRIRLIEDNNQREIATLKNKHQLEREAIIEKYGIETPLLIDLQKVQDNEMLDLEKDQAQKSKEIQEDLFWHGVKLQQELKDKKIKDEEEERMRMQEQINFSIQSTQNLLNAVSSMNEAAMNNQLARTEGNEEAQEKIRKKHFENQKKINTALALVHTFQSAQAAFASQLIVGDPTSLVRAKLAAVFATITGLANVAKIRSTQYMGGGGGATPVMAVTNMGMPVESSQQNFENINPTTTVSTSQTEMKVYVTSKDIRNALDDRSFIEKVTLT